MRELYKKIGELLIDQDYRALHDLKIDKPEHFNWVKEIFEDIHVKETPDKTALLWTDGKVTHHYTFLTLCNRYNQLINFLRSKGIQQGDVILTQMMLQRINWVTHLATIKAGYKLSPAASILGVKDLAYRFEKITPKVILADQDNVEKIDAAEKLAGIHIPVKIIVDGQREGWYPLAVLDEQSTEAESAHTKPDDVLFMFFTSGTTGMPKIVCHTQLSQPLGHLTTTAWIGITKDDIHYNISQPGWAKFAWSSLFAPWNVGATIFAFHTKERFSAATTLELIEKHKVTTLCAPPTVLRFFIQEDLKKYNFSLRQCVAAGEPLNPEIIEEWKEGTGLLVRDGFGQTESTCMVANYPTAKVKYGSMGKPTFLYDIIIADDNGKEVPINEEGNICVKTGTDQLNGIFKEYLYDKEKQAQVFRNGVYFTGDKAYKDEDGYIWFIGRDDDVIKASDYRIGPFEVESVLLEHDLIVESAVVGSPHAVKGFEVKAFVILNDHTKASAELAKEIFAYCREHLAPYKMPRKIEFVTELPKTISGKIKRVELRALQAERIAKKQEVPLEFDYTK
ncbi:MULTISPECIES: acyl-CoA synthetase [Myroides]|uniref:AMP-binding protein n=1 Tax=Myroides albus TaxID=2562892 RepID=A0A6I3LRY8_9FLAO|nr:MULTISPECIES: AMP-binding protein [Myroides]MTG98745.1 AMP-binding protein [Myroides albus]MVX36607.1 AMP-binding protein [Myroides sp. LoEW2-1]UVD79937.1 AMP-binding protein [Myroides albus]